jgi:hypothetical protein
MDKEKILIMIIARDVEYVLRHAHSMQLKWNRRCNKWELEKD